MKRTARFLLVTLFTTLAMGCGRNEEAAQGPNAGGPAAPQSQAPETERDVMEYTSAEVKIIYGPLADHTKRIEEQTEIQRLLSFFPGAGRGLKGPEPPAPWENAVVIQFTKADGTVLRVATNCDFWTEGYREGMLWFWSEGDGDWLLADADAFRKYMRDVLKEDSN